MPTVTHTPRDHETLLALARTPLTADQLYRLSVTFAEPYSSIFRVYERLAKLHEAGRLCRWRTIADGRMQTCYALSRQGFQLLHGEEVLVPRARSFRPVPVTRQPHTLALADAIVHLLIGAHQAAYRITGFCPEGTVSLPVGSEAVFPDAAFQIVGPNGASFSYFLELDRGTEALRMQSRLDTWQRKLRLYDRFQDASPRRFRVILLTTGGEDRLRNILDLAAETFRNPYRSLLYGSTQRMFLNAHSPLTDRIFDDHRHRLHGLMPRTTTGTCCHSGERGVSSFPAVRGERGETSHRLEAHRSPPSPSPSARPGAGQ